MMGRPDRLAHVNSRAIRYSAAVEYPKAKAASDRKSRNRQVRIATVFWPEACWNLADILSNVEKWFASAVQSIHSSDFIGLKIPVRNVEIARP